jgi:uncharacterized DUF497 family protein
MPRSPLGCCIDKMCRCTYIWRVRFVWNAESILHIARHGVAPQEAERVLTDAETIVIPARGRRFSAYGVGSTGRSLRVIYERVGRDGIRVITAYPIRRRDLERIRQEAQP